MNLQSLRDVSHRALRSPLAVCLLLGNLACLLVLGVRAAGILQTPELALYDQYVRWLPKPAQDPWIVLIGETEEDIRRWQYPLTDALFAEALAKIAAAGPRVIGVDKYRATPVPPGTDELNAVITRYPYLIWVMKFGDDRQGGYSLPPPPILVGSDRVGFSDLPLDTDGTVRRGLLYLDDGRHVYPSLALAVTLQFLQKEGIVPQADSRHPDHLQLGPTTLRPLAANDGPYVAADPGGYQFPLNFGVTSTHFRTYSLSQLLDGRVPPAVLRDKIVLFGSMAETLRDYLQSPLEVGTVGEPGGTGFSRTVYGVQQHAMITSQLLRFALQGAQPLRSLPQLLENLWIWLWCVGAGLLGLWQTRLTRFAVAVFTAGVALAAICYFLLLDGVWLPLLPPLIGAALAAAGTKAYLSAHESAEKQLLMQIFARHVSPTVADTLWQGRDQFLEQGRLRSQRLTATVLFTDIQGFTSISENLEPTVLMDWLNHYLEAMAEVVMAHGGVVNKYIGDAVMALFGVPVPRAGEQEIAHDACQAVSCALAMSTRLQQLNAEWRQAGLPSIGMRIGIHTGPLIAGSVGSRQRLEYTVIGDTVNIASRLESLNKDAGVGEPSTRVCRILIGEPTFRCLDERFQVDYAGTARLRGKREEVAVYRVQGFRN